MLSSWPAKMKPIQSKIRLLKCSQHHTLIFRRSRAAESGIWPKFELIQAFMHVLVTCRNEEDPIKNEGASLRVFKTGLSL